MRYINRLQQENETLSAEVERLNEGLAALKVYMASEKFHQDTTVQVGDIMRWIDQIKSGALV
jgi:cell division protein FtsB